MLSTPEQMIKFALVQRLTQKRFDNLQRRFPGTFEYGGCLLLGKHYAHPASKILMLGINPGMGSNTKLDVGLHPYNYLLDGQDEIRSAYFSNARKFFDSSPELKSAMPCATFGFCSPFRTATWSGLPKHLRQALLEESRPILMAMMHDCDPRLVIVAGVEGMRAFAETMDDAFRVGRNVSSNKDSGTYQWSACEGTHSGKPLIVAQVPHFSRANSLPRLQACARWLTGLLPPQ